MFDSIISLENLFSAWREFRRGKRSRSDVQYFERHLEDNIFALRDDLIFGRYQHGPYHRFHIFDPKHRIIHKATVRDRLAHHAIYRILQPVLERSFIFDSYSCRIGKGMHAAVRRLGKFTRKASSNYQGPCWVLKFDIRKFFDSVDHGILLDILYKKIPCDRTFFLLSGIVRSYRSVSAVRGGSLGETQRPAGIPIGNLTSQLFANIYLDAFDHFIKERLQISHYIRYTDDAVIVHPDCKLLSALLPPIERWLWQERRLMLHPTKVEIRKLSQGIDFLGYVTLSHHRVLRTKTKRRMFRKICAANFSSYSGLVGKCDGYRLLEKLKWHISFWRKV